MSDYYNVRLTITADDGRPAFVPVRVDKDAGDAEIETLLRMAYRELLRFVSEES